MRSRPQLALGKHFERPAQRPGEEGVSHGPEARLDRHSWPEPTQATLGGAKQRVGDTPVEQGDQTRRAAHAPGRQPGLACGQRPGWRGAPLPLGLLKGWSATGLQLDQAGWLPG